MRFAKLQALLQTEKLGAIVVYNDKNRQYFSGFSGSSGVLVVTRDKRFLLTDFRYIDQAAAEAPGYKIVRHKALDFYEILTATVKEAGVGRGERIGFEGDQVIFNVYKKLTEFLPDNEFVPICLDSCRRVKDGGEIRLIKKAAAIADEAFKRTLGQIKPGVSEIDVAMELEYNMRKLCAEKPAFNTIVASGQRGALPHGKASEKVLAKGDLVIIDFGAVYQGYNSDMTRTVVLGRADAKQREIYSLVLNAQLAGLEALTAGKSGQEIDSVARAVIEKAGYGEYFGHGLGHSVGLAIHESPSLSPNGQIKMEPGMIVSVEPGIYLPGWGGVRIEDLAVVLPAGREVLTATTKELIEIV